MKKNSKPNTFARVLFILYCAVLLWLLFGRNLGWNEELTYKQMLQQNMNLTPLYTIKNYLRVVLYRTNDTLFTHCLINLLGNVLLFIPIGYLLPKLWKSLRNFFIFLLFVLLSILMVELTQLFTLLGSFDVDDIILNVSGMLIGYIIWAIAK